MIKRISLLVMIFILSLPTSVMAAEGGSGKIEGRIVNGTEGGSSVADQNITLKTYINDAESGSATTKTDADGRFVFEGLSTDSGYTYQATFTYQEAEYTSESVSFPQGETSTSLNIPVYDATNSDQAVTIPTAHTVIYVGQGSLEVNQFYYYANASDRVYVGSGEITSTGKRRTLDFPLPAKATGIQYGNGLMECCVLPTQEGFVDTMPVFPEGRDIVYGYTVKYSGDTYTFTQKIGYPIGQYNLLVQGEGVQIVSSRLADQGPVNMGDSNFNYSVGENLTAGDTLVVQLSGLPQASSQWTVIWIVLVLIILGGGFSFVYLRRKGRLQPVRAEGSLEQRRQRLLAELAQMDDDFENGKISEEVYHRRRTERKAQLVELMRRSKE